MKPTAPHSISDCVRRSPVQERSRARVERFLDAAVREFARAGYDGATMNAIARRAAAPIASLYQYFPNKASIARAVRTRHVDDVDAMCASLEGHARARDVAAFTDHFVALMIRFVKEHPAFLALQDAPTATHPVHARNRFRKRMGSLLADLLPASKGIEHRRVTDLVVNLNKSMLRQLASGTPGDRRWLDAEYRGLLKQYLGTRNGAAASPGGAAHGAAPSRHTVHAPLRRRVGGTSFNGTAAGGQGAQRRRGGESRLGARST